jgi:glutaredoxin 3
MYTVYSKPACPWCDRAKALLQSKNLAYEELILDIGQDKDSTKKYVSLAELKSVVPNAQSVPQILQDGTLIGGFTDLNKLLTEAST